MIEMSFRESKNAAWYMFLDRVEIGTDIEDIPQDQRPSIDAEELAGSLKDASYRGIKQFLDKVLVNANLCPNRLHGFEGSDEEPIFPRYQ